MAGFFRGPTLTASWYNQRIFPRGEPTFDSPASPAAPRTDHHATSSPTSAAAPPPARTLPDGRTLRFLDVAATPEHSPPPAAPSAPPPLYFPGEGRRRHVDLPPGHLPSINTATTLHAKVQWEYHPAGQDQGWMRYLRVKELGRALRGDKEKAWDGWPREFGGRDLPPGQLADVGDEEEGGTAAQERTRSGSTVGGRRRSMSLSLSRRSTSGADSGVALTPRPTMSLEVQHPLYPLYKTRIGELNEIIGEQLYTTRAWMAMLEIMAYVWIVALVVALATGGGKQTGFTKGVEIALVLVILLTGTGVNAVRMRRYTLSRLLRQRQRDWSPLPTTLSTTNRQLMANWLDGTVEAHNGAGEVASAVPKDVASLRWRLRETEGSYWLSYRPIILVELVTPASAANPLAYLPVVDPSNPGEEPPTSAVSLTTTTSALESPVTAL
ncbi:hypothetical protein JCM8097_008558 [Rhodosporidiobolus ruineniae]